MKNILCFGDSNTWGYTPGTGERYAADVRWTGVMQNALGADYHVIEDGMNARTTVYDDMWSMWRNGKDALPISLIAQKPLDLLIISLGTNDLKFTDARGSARGIDTLITLVNMVQARKESSLVFPNGVKILVVSPILLHPDVDTDAQRNSSVYGKYAESLPSTSSALPMLRALSSLTPHPLLRSLMLTACTCRPSPTRPWVLLWLKR